jgi:radical SAM-linked protein
MQRLRLRFNRGPELKYISHLDIIRLWHRAFRRAGVDLAYSEGFNPHPRIYLASPLPLGVLAESELMDVVLSSPVTPHSLLAGINRQLPPGITVLQVIGVPLNTSSLQALVRQAEYRVEVSAVISAEEAETRIASLLALESLPWFHQRQDTRREYDLRRNIYDLWLEDSSPAVHTIVMLLRCDSEGTGRPEQVIKALELGEPLSICRRRLILENA